MSKCLGQDNLFEEIFQKPYLEMLLVDFCDFLKKLVLFC